NATTVRMDSAVSKPQRSWPLMGYRAVAAFVGLVILTVALVGYMRFFRHATNNAQPVNKYESSRAYDVYLRARVNLKSENPAQIENAISLLKQVISIDPNFAPGWAELARASNIKSFYISGS